MKKPGKTPQPALRETPKPTLAMHFYATEAGNEPVREWLRGLPPEIRKAIGEDIKTVQFGWPLGMPLVRKMEPGLWEVRSKFAEGIARVFFTLTDDGEVMLLAHGFIKKSEKMPASELTTVRARLNDCRSRSRK
ncbi:MAG: type II toxin-antitoxin system RelE/ParE family toxin [Pseudoxanthomonas sp.]